MTKKPFSFSWAHRFIALAVLGIVLGSGFAYLRNGGENGGTRYVFAEVRRGTFVSSISSTGQVLALQQVDVKSDVSAKVLLIGAKPGEYMRQGTLIARLDPEDGEKAVRDAETNLLTARLSLEQFVAPPDELSLLQEEHAVAQAEESKKDAEEQIEKSREDGFNAVSNAFLDLPGVMTGLQDILFSNTIAGGGLWNIDFYFSSFAEDNSKARLFRDDAQGDYDAARTAYDATFALYKAASRTSSSEETQSLIDSAYDMTKLISEAIKSANNFIQLYQDEMTQKGRKAHATSDTHLSSLSGFTGKANSHISNLLSARRAIIDNATSLLNAERTLRERELSLEDLKDGPDALDVRSKQLDVKEREEDLREAKKQLLDYEIRAPFDGVLATLDVLPGDEVSAGNVIATFATRQKIAEISLNEVDIAGVKLGQKATLTFDAIPDLTITGQVAEIDTIGGTSQGVVTYNVKIIFDTNNAEVKASMTVTASIVTQSKRDVLLIPNSAVKSQGRAAYVEIPEIRDDLKPTLTASVGGMIFKNPLQRQRIEVGLSNDEFTEVTDGVDEGDVVVTRVILQNSNGTATQSQQNGLRIPGITPPGSGGGGGMRGGFR